MQGGADNTVRIWDCKAALAGAGDAAGAAEAGEEEVEEADNGYVPLLNSLQLPSCLCKHSLLCKYS